ncbi:hypothetical protein CSAL01_11045 [Colletotrichum salicis]|uniref:Uncharacterized protein n=1 Tax=Colletotrichum salicis TaxID=1209931 RepID=A0A135RTD4_9PEZI|nr:hypothetical protein CSAL01_11045 [Colletotrichum salicis]
MSLSESAHLSGLLSFRSSSGPPQPTTSLSVRGNSNADDDDDLELHLAVPGESFHGLHLAHSARFPRARARARLAAQPSVSPSVRMASKSTPPKQVFFPERPAPPRVDQQSLTHQVVALSESGASGDGMALVPLAILSEPPS